MWEILLKTLYLLDVGLNLISFSIKQMYKFYLSITRNGKIFFGEAFRTKFGNDFVKI